MSCGKDHRKFASAIISLALKKTPNDVVLIQFIIFRYLTTFVSLKTFPTLSSAISVPYAMLAFCTIACAGGAAAMTWLPETRGLTLSQLAKIFGGNEEEDPDLTTRQCVASWARAISLTVIMAPDLGPQQQVQPLEVKNENEQKRE